MITNYTPVIGFEIHVELGTRSKMFCPCPADHFAKEPNTQTCPVCLGLPGALPVPNAKAVEWTVLLGLALGCQINQISKFDRKNYFYPDLPKGYQISQYDLPFCHNGQIKIGTKTVRITRVHLEEDTGKLQHWEEGKQRYSLIDFNRSGVPLVEIVTEPDFSDPEEGVEFLKEVQSIIRCLGISTADMEKGSMRLEANVSVRKPGQKVLPPYKVELKNINSFRFLKKAVAYDIKRQQAILETGEIPPQETRGFSESTGETTPQRSKEEANDYRYFPEPDIPPISLTNESIEKIKLSLPKLPSEIRSQLISLGITRESATQIATDPSRLKLLQEVIKTDHTTPPQIFANLLINQSPSDGETWSAQSLIRARKALIPDRLPEGQIKSAVIQFLDENPTLRKDYLGGKTQVLGFMIAKITQQLGKADPRQVKEVLLQTLQSN